MGSKAGLAGIPGVGSLALPYLRIYICCSVCVFFATGLNIILDPIFIFLFGVGVRGAALARLMNGKGVERYYLFFDRWYGNSA